MEKLLFISRKALVYFHPHISGLCCGGGDALLARMDCSPSECWMPPGGSLPHKDKKPTLPFMQDHTPMSLTLDPNTTFETVSDGNPYLASMSLPLLKPHAPISDIFMILVVVLDG